MNEPEPKRSEALGCLVFFACFMTVAAPTVIAFVTVKQTDWFTILPFRLSAKYGDFWGIVFYISGLIGALILLPKVVFKILYALTKWVIHSIFNIDIPKDPMAKSLEWK